MLDEGQRIGRFVIFRDIDGRVHALAAGSISAVCQTDESALLMLQGGKIVHVERSMDVVLGWLDGRS